MSDSRGVVRPGIYKEIVYRDVAFLYRSFDNVIPVQLMYINMIFSFSGVHLYNVVQSSCVERSNQFPKRL
jgi:hypothetical protein